MLVRLVRVNMLQALRSDHVEAARARGLPERSVVLRHALRSALVPVVAVVGLQFALLLSGAVLTEATFSWPGLGQTLYNFLRDRDYTAVQGLVTFYALFVVAVSLAHRRRVRPGSIPGSGTREAGRPIRAASGWRPAGAGRRRPAGTC